MPSTNPFTVSSILMASLATCLLAGAGSIFAQDTPDDAPPARVWGPAETVRSLGLGATRSVDEGGAPLRGACVAGEIFDEAEADMGGGVWLSFEEGSGQRVMGAGIHHRLTLLKTGPVRFAPRVRLGIEDRRRPPVQGSGGLFAAGAELAVWFGANRQIAIYAEREFRFRSGTRNEIGIVLRFAKIL